MGKLKKDMCTGPLLPNIILYTIPIVLTTILQLLFNAADLVIVGRFCGSHSVAAVGATSSLIHLIVNFFMGISIGSGVTVAHAIGGHDDKQVSRTIHTAIPVALGCGIIITVIGISCATPILKLLNTPAEILHLSATYINIYFAGSVFMVLYNFCAAILRAAGDTKSPLKFLTLAGFVNVVLNIVFVTAFHLNVAGVALATSISNMLSALLALRALMKRDDACKFYFSKIKIDIRSLKKMLMIGIPSGIQSSMFSISNVIIQSSVNSFGATFVSGASAAGNIEGFVYVLNNAFCQTAMNFAGQNTGAGNYKRVHRTMLICLACVTVSGSILGATVYYFGPSLLSIYITDSAEAIACGMIRFSYICLPYFLGGLMEVASGTLRGMGASLSTMFTTIFGVCGFRILWIYTVFSIPKFHTPDMLYVSYPITWTLTFIILLVIFYIVYNKRKKQIKSC